VTKQLLLIVAALLFVPMTAVSETAPLVVDAEWLSSHLDDPGTRVIDIGRDIYEFGAGHIPGASYVDKEWLGRKVDGVPGTLVSTETISVVLDAAGVTDTSTVVIYDEAPGLWAARLLWAMEYHGHGDVHVLNGGWMNWICCGFEVEAHRPHVADGDFEPVVNDSLLATSDWILEHLEDPGVVLLDVRSPEELSGEDKKSERGGRIPGAVHYEWSRSLEPDGSGLLRPEDEILGALAELGVTPDKEVVTYCQIGARAAHSYLILRHLGFDRVRVYDGSWAEWGNDPGLPVETP